MTDLAELRRQILAAAAEVAGLAPSTDCALSAEERLDGLIDRCADTLLVELTDPVLAALASAHNAVRLAPDSRDLREDFVEIVRGFVEADRDEQDVGAGIAEVRGILKMAQWVLDRADDATDPAARRRGGLHDMRRASRRLNALIAEMEERETTP